LVNKNVLSCLLKDGREVDAVTLVDRSQDRSPWLFVQKIKTNAAINDKKMSLLKKHCSVRN